MDPPRGHQTAQAPPLPITIPPATGPTALIPPTTSQLAATPSLNGIPRELRENIFYRLIENEELPILIHVYHKQARKYLRDKFLSLLFAGGAIRREALNMWNENSVQFIKFRNYQGDPLGAKPFIWAFSRGWRPFSAPTSRRLEREQCDFDMPHSGLSNRQRIETTDLSHNRAKERMLDCLRHVQNVHLDLPDVATKGFLTEHDMETYLNDAKWLVGMLNAWPILKKVYIYIGNNSIWNTFDAPTPATDERRCRIEELLSPFQHLNNVEIEVLKFRDWELTPGTNFADFAIVDHVKDLRRLAKKVPEQKLIDNYFIPSQTNAPKTSAFQRGVNQPVPIQRQDWTQEELSDDWLFGNQSVKKQRTS
ncbi:hypothetical protein BLS_000894 [Venturia inaequalis]|uniref:Uncharacterized protein n=1 Tax=Venturia inaequalis TaxID=5025 RepID=A0A8H3YQL0_VENIN|nr:hypothetical protein BLS_000894 [Venturia inaequalis]KAE9965223.1 hypothetical protein EG328_009900 [Venturia inaequalis]KAE9968393.1 hypothetical protein EG327_011064 [Venturia inaequalis]